MSTPKTTALIERVLELDARGTGGPWRYAQLYEGQEARALIDNNGYLFGQSDDLENGALIEKYRTSCPALAKALQIAIKHLEQTNQRSALAQIEGVIGSSKID